MTQKEILRVVSLTVDHHSVTFFTEDADTVIMRLGNPALAELVRQAALVTAEGKIAEIDLGSLNTGFQEITKKSNGLIRFFTVARRKISNFLGTKEKAAVPVVLSQVEEYLTQETIMAPTEEETVVMVVDNVVVPNVEKITPLVEAAVKRDRPTGLMALMERMAKRSKEAAHSVEDLLTFLERADLPIADDGTILAYRVMKSYSQGVHAGKGKYADCHTGNVAQDVGMIVEVPDHLVDMTRSHECSNGLHIARRSYLRSFRADHLFLCAIAPEDVLVVPHRDPNKVRVRRYTILGKFSQEANDLIRSGKSITHLRADAGLIAMAMRGELPPPHSKVSINGQGGTRLIYTSLGNDAVQVSYNPTDEDFDAAQSVEAQTDTSKTYVDIADIQEIAEIGHAVTDDEVVEDEEIVYCDCGEQMANWQSQCDFCEAEIEEVDESCYDCGSTTVPLTVGVCDSCLETKTAPKVEPEKKEADVVLPPAVEAAPLTHRQQMAKFLSDYAYASYEAQEGILKEMLIYKKATKKGWAKLGVDETEHAALIERSKNLKD